jgi:hypothetical protein
MKMHSINSVYVLSVYKFSVYKSKLPSKQVEFALLHYP